MPQGTDGMAHTGGTMVLPAPRSAWGHGEPARGSAGGYSPNIAADVTTVGLLSSCRKLDAQLAGLAGPHPVDVVRVEAPDAMVALTKANVVDVAVLHWELGDYRGLDCCKALRGRAASVALPIMVLSEWTREAALTRAFTAGTDDYAVLPVVDRELALRIAKLRQRPPAAAFGQFLMHGDIVLDRNTQQVARAGRTMKLKPADFLLLRAFMEQPGEVLCHESLVLALRKDGSSADADSMRFYVASLRKALTACGHRDPIRTVTRSGYVLD